MPPDLLVQSSKSISDNHESRPLRESECKIYLIVTLSVALTFCVLSATIVVVACFKKYQVSMFSDAGFNQISLSERKAQISVSLAEFKL